MRIDARNGVRRAWVVWHVEQCRSVRAVWVDDRSAQWGEHQNPVIVDLSGKSVLSVHQARRIVISVPLRLVLINPVGDDEHERGGSIDIRLDA